MWTLVSFVQFQSHWSFPRELSPDKLIIRRYILLSSFFFEFTIKMYIYIYKTVNTVYRLKMKYLRTTFKINGVISIREISTSHYHFGVSIDFC